MFKVGDIVIGNAKAKDYSCTTTGTKWKVTGVYDNYIQVTTVDGGPVIGSYTNVFKVIANRFDLLEKGKRVKRIPLYPEVFVYSNGKDYTVKDALTGEHIEDVDDIILLNCTFKKIAGQRGVVGTPSYNYNKYIQGYLKYPNEFITLEYRSSKFIKPHYVGVYNGQPKEVVFMHMKNGVMKFRDTGLVSDDTLRLYVNTKLHTPEARPLETEASEPGFLTMDSGTSAGWIRVGAAPTP